MTDRQEQLTRVLDKITAKIRNDERTTVEDVRLIAALWAASDYPKLAAAGDVTAADLDLAQAVKANPGAGDATAVTIAEAAVRWRQATTGEHGSRAARFDGLLAVTVAHLTVPPVKRVHRIGLAGLSVVVVAAVADVANMLTRAVPAPWAAIPSLVMLVAFVATMFAWWRVTRR